MRELNAHEKGVIWDFAFDMMTQRNLLYTAVTRARKLCVLTGSRRAISIAIHNNKVTQRFTALEWRLRGSERLPA